MPVLESSDIVDALPLEDLPPAYTSVDTAAGSAGQQSTGPTFIPQL